MRKVTLAAIAATIAIAASTQTATAGEIRQLFARATVQPAAQVLREQRFVVCDVCPGVTEFSALRRNFATEQVAAEQGMEGKPTAKAKGASSPLGGDKSKEERSTEFKVFFDFDKYSWKRGEKSKVHSYANELREALQIKVKGYTDGTGSKGYNDRLASRRANAVAAEIKSLGVKKGIDVSSEGKCCYLSDNPRLNRRVEVKITHTSQEGGK